MHSAKFVHCTPNAEELIVDMARVSNPINQGHPETAPRLLRYLLRMGHVSPFEMATLAVEITTTRAISPQILRHGKGFSFQEFSQRYSNVNQLELIAPFHLRSQDSKNKQASHDDLPDWKVERLTKMIEKHLWDAQELYKSLIEEGVALECARSVLPQCQPTKLYMHGNLRSWIHYLTTRCAPETQLEHRNIANSIKQIFSQNFPIIHKAVFEPPPTCSSP
tara:strand:- start:143 stop:805 length:663 start_codon:yes stop_codon:yes gene_type:complete